MGRATRFGFVLAGALLLVAGAYTGYWFIVAGRIENGVSAWARSAHDHKFDVSWKNLRVSGFPGKFRLNLQGVTVRDGALIPSPELHLPVVSGTAEPWDFADWHLAAGQGFDADMPGGGGRAPAQLAVQTADGVVSIGREGGWKLWLRSQGASLEAGRRVVVNSADVWVIAPGRDTETQLALAAEARQVRLPVAIGPLGDAIDELGVAATVKGAIPNGRLPEALAAWRDAGGTIEFENVRLRWGPIDTTGSGTVALDQELQPVGAFSGGIEGYDEILTALVQRGQMRASDASLARIALTMLAKGGADGKPEIRTAFTIRNGQMFLGPARLGKTPRFTWE